MELIVQQGSLFAEVRLPEPAVKQLQVLLRSS